MIKAIDAKRQTDDNNSFSKNYPNVCSEIEYEIEQAVAMGHYFTKLKFSLKPDESYLFEKMLKEFLTGYGYNCYFNHTHGELIVVINWNLEEDDLY